VRYCNRDFLACWMVLDAMATGWALVPGYRGSALLAVVVACGLDWEYEGRGIWVAEYAYPARELHINGVGDPPAFRP
jgi:hypothetical protein